MPELPEEAVEAALNGHPEPWRATLEAAVSRAAPALRKQGAEEERARTADVRALLAALDTPAPSESEEGK